MYWLGGRVDRGGGPWNDEVPSQEVPGSTPGAGSSREGFSPGEKSHGFPFRGCFCILGLPLNEKTLVAYGCVVSLLNK